MDKYKKLFNNSIAFAIGNLGSKLITFFMLPLYTYKLTTSDYGTSDLVQTTVSMLLPIVSLNIFDAVLRFVMDDDSNNKEIFTIGCIISNISSLFAIVISVLLFFFGTSYSLYVAIILILQSYQSLFSQYIKAIGKVRDFAINGILLSFITAICNIIMLVPMNLGITGYLLSIIIGLVCSSVFLVIKCNLIKEYDYKYFNFSTLREMFKYSIPLIPNSVAWFATNAINRYFILYIIGTTANGIYAVANKIPTLLSVLNSIFFQSWQLSAIEEFNSSDKELYYSKVFSVYLNFLFLGVSGIMYILKPIMTILVSDQFYSAWKYVPLLLLTVLYSSFSSFFGQYYIAAKRTNGIFFTTLMGAFCNILLNSVLIRKFGLNGAALSSTLSFLIIWIIRWINTRKIVATKVKLNDLILNHLVFFFQYWILFSFSGTSFFILSSIAMFVSIFINSKVILKIVNNLLKKV
ncbi:polysaccharide biosynthesis C-terminal domain-containing protein [Enterococcus malodoratus]|uniref:Uncharacterized protein n=1 Tax=Enterococcus malodoratus ATCC 43197 TaxID=1158601 RepID=R2R1D1_9ENTE|nr:polysaccharide biosynthesis C-terminal domain-containing protein [Enterococcus malodoratus]EOH77455.1 hypothetical protein UAI_02092 [Enterococcus malodoratus ATCC 43197]EOT64131.1 hypothetical protein I585_03328 [Enterococcus malodoratus ATCC 43197]OJG64325.1 hypothetical protein RV07_GL004298 [Enterococcus malodoratus]SPX00864.1 MOP superfamily multidrug/oligosaccharidyl-lipid/polysaccharide flippase transporter [Enterococcus malodoratus]STD66187.1 MOP superfamily multidrug/oligosaccharid